jgi:glycosyltransferase involved in cell wall biosynthesis
LRIVTLSQHYAPEPCDLRGHALGRELVARGHQVTALCGLPNYPYGKLYRGYRQRPWTREEMDGVRVFRLPIFPDHSLSAKRRAAHYLSFAASASLLGPMLCGRADAMWVYHPPLTTGIPARWVSSLRRVPFVYEIQDLWPDTLIASGVVAESRAIRWLEGLAAKVYRAASVIVVQSPGFRTKLIERGVPADKLVFVPNWADEDLFRPVSRDPEVGRAHGLEGRFNVMFAGNMGPAQALNSVLEAAALVADLPDVQMVLVGDGVSYPQLKADAQGLTNVRFLGRKPVKEMAGLYAWADALLIHLRDEPLFRITIPGKTMSYLACGRPIVCAMAGDAAQIVSDARAGVLCPPESPEALAQAIRDLYRMPVEQREEMGANGRSEFLRKYTKKVLVDTYERLLTDVAARRAIEGSPSSRETEPEEATCGPRA